MPALAERKRVTSDLKSWLDDIAAYERAFKKYEVRVDKITKKYRDEYREENETAVSRFNILWSNVQTLSAATFARLPKPDVSRRFRDNDPVGRVASQILERGLDYEIQHYSDYRASLKSCVLDRFLGGRAVAWVRYEPHFRASEIGQPEGGLQVTEDIEDEEIKEQLDYECAPVDYVHLKDFGHNVARTWEEVYRVWRRVYMTEDALQKRFGEETAKLIPMDASPSKDDAEIDVNRDKDRACIYEGWDRNTKTAVWISKGLKDFLDERPDPLGLEEFFPCPKPMFATLTNDSLIPVPDYCLYQDQANELDVLAGRIDGLVRALRVQGIYDASQPAIARLFTESGDSDTPLIPAKNWQAFVEKQGLKGSMDLVDLAPIAAALHESYAAMEQIKAQIYEITGISDIIRGQSDPSSTATAEQIKGQFASLRLKSNQEQVAQFATEILQIKSQIICNKFDPRTVLKISAADQLSEQDKQYIPQALMLLMGPRARDPKLEAPNPLRSFRVEVAADSLIYLDEKTEKEDRMAFLETQTKVLASLVAPALQSGSAAPVLVPLVMEMWKFAVTAFRVGKSIEGAFDEATEKLKQLAMQPPQIPPEMIKQVEDQAMQKASAQTKIDNAAHEAAFQGKQAKAEIDHARRSADLDLREMKFSGEQALA